MIIIKVKGGLGNQMFQYALARNFACKGKKVVFDLSMFKKKSTRETSRMFGLYHYNIKPLQECGIIYPIGYKCIHKIFPDKEIYIKEKVVMQTDKIQNAYGKYIESCISYNSNIEDVDNVYLEGYWQSAKYFSSIENILRREFVIKDSLYSKKTKQLKECIEKKNSVSIHVRRTDYLDFSKEYSNICDINYYLKAINEIKGKIKNPSFFFFSDDLEWCKMKFKDLENVTFAENLDCAASVEMNLMSLCKHNIIANSSFSWWGAWLNQNTDKVVIAPKLWDNFYWTPDIWNESWLKI